MSATVPTFLGPMPANANNNFLEINSATDMNDALPYWRSSYATNSDFEILADWIWHLKLPSAEPLHRFSRFDFISDDHILRIASTFENSISDGIHVMSSGTVNLPQNLSYVTIGHSSSSSVGGLSLKYTNSRWSDESNAKAPFALFRAKVIAWSKLETGWDGEDATVPSDVIITNALDFIDLIEKSWVPVPSIYIAGDGEIGFRWTIGGTRASVSFLDDGYIVGFCPDYCGLPAVDVDIIYTPLQSNPPLSKLLDSIRVRFQ